MAKKDDIGFLEQHVEKIILGITALALGAVLIFWVAMSPRKFPLSGTEEYSPQRVDDALLELAKAVERRLQSEIPKPEPVPDYPRLLELVRSNPYPNRISSYIEFISGSPRVDDRDPNTVPKQEALTLAALLPLPAPERPDVRIEREVQMVPEARVRRRAGRGAPVAGAAPAEKLRPQEVLAAHGAGIYPVGELREAWQKELGKAKAKIPSDFIVVAVEVERRQALPGGGYGPEQRVSPPPRDTPLPVLPEFTGENLNEVSRAVEALARSAVQQEILEPPYPDIIWSEQKIGTWTVHKPKTPLSHLAVETPTGAAPPVPTPTPTPPPGGLPPMPPGMVPPPPGGWPGGVAPPMPTPPPGGWPGGVAPPMPPGGWPGGVIPTPPPAPPAPPSGSLSPLVIVLAAPPYTTPPSGGTTGRPPAPPTPRATPTPATRPRPRPLATRPAAATPAPTGVLTPVTTPPLPQQLSLGMVEVWFHDTQGLAPGQTYQYHYRLILVNPLFGRLRNVKDRADAEKLTLDTPWSEWSPPETGKWPTEFFIYGYDGTRQIVVVDVFTQKNGQWVKGQFGVSRGQPIGGPQLVELRSGDKTEKVTVDFSTGAVVIDLDFAREHRVSPEVKRTTVEMMYLDPDGQLRTRTRTEDETSPRYKILDAACPGNPGARIGT